MTGGHPCSPCAPLSTSTPSQIRPATQLCAACSPYISLPSTGQSSLLACIVTFPFAICPFTFHLPFAFPFAFCLLLVLLPFAFCFSFCLLPLAFPPRYQQPQGQAPVVPSPQGLLAGTRSDVRGSSISDSNRQQLLAPSVRTFRTQLMHILPDTDYACSSG
jgi:hypothetical protein